MGRNRIRTDQENSVYDKEYQKVYKQERQNREAEYFKLSASRSYYRKVLRNMDSDNPRFEKVSQKVNELDKKVNEYLSTRNRYARLDVCEKVNAKLAGC